jgi:hypothetical protein
MAAPWLRRLVAGPPTAEARVRARVSPCEIRGGQSGTGTGLSPSPLVFPCQYHRSIRAPYSYINNHYHHLREEQWIRWWPQFGDSLTKSTKERDREIKSLIVDAWEHGAEENTVLGPNQQNGENYTPRNFRIVLRQVLLRWSDEGGWDEQGM